MILKIGLSLGVIAICFMIGVKKATALESREYILRDGINLFKRIKNEMKYMLATIPNALEISRQDVRQELKDVIGSIVLKYMESKSIDFMLDVREEMETLTMLNSYDKQILANGISKLGTSDIDTQESIIENTISMLENQVEQAKHIKQKNYKMYRTLGLAAGLLIVVILI